MWRRSLIVTVGGLALPATAIASSNHYFPRPHQRCRAHYVRHTVEVRKHKHGHTFTARRAECVKVVPKGTSTTPTPSSNTATPGAPATPTALTSAPTGSVATTTSVNIHDSLTTGSVVWFSMSGSAFDGSGQQLVGKPLTYTVTDATTGHAVATFSGTANSYSSCAVYRSLNSPQNTIQTYTGQPVPPLPACNLGTFSIPAGDAAVVTASFAGDSTYAPSRSPQTAFS